MSSHLSALLVLCTAAAPVAAQVTCGDTVGRGRKVTLTANLGPCDGVGAAVVVSGGSLDLGGFAVTCADTDLDEDLPQGVVLTGRKSKVTNGRVEGCMNGIGLAGDGRHLVQNVTVTGSHDDGIDVAQGDRNKIVSASVTGSLSDGIYVRTDRNTLTDCIANQNAEDGIDLPSTADKNKLTRSHAEGNGDDGIEVSGDRNKLAASTALGNAEVGIDLGGRRNKVLGGTSQGNTLADVADCTGNKVKKLAFTAATPDCQ